MSSCKHDYDWLPDGYFCPSCQCAEIEQLQDNLRQANDEMARKNAVIVQLRADLHAAGEAVEMISKGLRDTTKEVRCE